MDAMLRKSPLVRLEQSRDMPYFEEREKGAQNTEQDTSKPRKLMIGAKNWHQV